MPTSGSALTVIVVVGPLRERAGECLRSLLGQGLEERLEVLVVDLEPPGSPPVPGADDPTVRVLRLAPETTFAAARARAVAEATAPVVAFVEEHVRVLPGWGEALLEAHGGPWAGVGGEAANGNPGVGASDVAGLISYGYWYPPLRRGETDLLPGHNASFRTSVLRGYGEELEELLVCDLVLHDRLRADGHRLFLEPRARFAHLNEADWRTQALGMHLWYRCYGPLRARLNGWSPWRRALYVAAVPAIPFYFVAGFARRLRRERPHLLPLLLARLPHVLAVHLAAAAGQAVGLLLGPGRAPSRFTRFELSAPRPAGEEPRRNATRRERR